MSAPAEPMAVHAPGAAVRRKAKLALAALVLLLAGVALSSSAVRQLGCSCLRKSRVCLGSVEGVLASARSIRCFREYLLGCFGQLAAALSVSAVP